MAVIAIGILAYKDSNVFRENDTYSESKEFTDHRNDKKPPIHKKDNEHISFLFGKDTQIKKGNRAQQKIPETRLKLVLKGTFTHELDSNASALISEQNKNTVRYYIGDNIPGNAELISVHAGEIILRRNGQDELLKLPILSGDRELKANHIKTANTASTSTPIQHQKPLAQSSSSPSSRHQQKLKERLARLRSSRTNKTNN